MAVAIGIAEAELFRGFWADASAMKISAGDFSRRSGERSAEMLLREFVHLVEGFALAGIVVGVLGTLGHGDAVAFGEALEGFEERDAFEFLDEADDVALGLAAEAVIELLGGVDGKRRGFFLMKRAETLIAVGACLAEADFFADDADDVDARFQFLDEVHSNCSLSRIVAAGTGDKGGITEDSLIGERGRPTLQACLSFSIL